MQSNFMNTRIALLPTYSPCMYAESNFNKTTTFLLFLLSTSRKAIIIISVIKYVKFPHSWSISFEPEFICIFFTVDVSYICKLDFFIQLGSKVSLNYFDLILKQRLTHIRLPWTWMCLSMLSMCRIR